MKLKILFLAPHLSTGGMPSFLLKQIELLKDEFDISVVEYQFYTADFVVQRNAIQSLVKLYTLGENKLELLDIIKEVSPDVIHIHDPSERFDNELMSQSLIVVNDLVEYLSTHYLPIFGIPNLQCFTGLPSSLFLSTISLRR
jgi:hypothetical protein